MAYTIGEVAKKLDLSPSALRYYDKEGLLPFVTRTPGGIRTFREEDLEWLRVITCLKKTGMPLCDIRRFVEMAMQGDATITERLALIKAQKAAVERQIAAWEDTLRILAFKEWYYQTAEEKGTTAVPREMPLSDVPAEFRAVRLHLCGK